MRGPEDYGVVTTSVGTEADAARIADFLISEKLAACVQTMPIQSRYVWKGQMMREGEILLAAKTRVALFEDAIAAIKSLHPYETPEIVAASFAAGFAGYFAWIDDATRR